jgi:hypothetical protein
MELFQLIILFVILIFLYNIIPYDDTIQYENFEQSHCTLIGVNAPRPPPSEFDIDISDLEYLINENVIVETDPVLSRFNNEKNARGYKDIINIIEPVQPLQPQRLVPLRQFEFNPLINMDTQNVHDTTIQKITKNKYTDLKTMSSHSNGQGVFTPNALDSYINNSDLSKEKKQTLLKTVGKIKNRNSNLTNFDGDTEFNILINTWNNSNNTVKDQILNELLDCTSGTHFGDNLYCPTGVATRIVNASFIEDPESMPKTKEMINEEMMNSASVIRTQLEQDPKYQQLSDTEANNKLKNTILEKYNTDYKDIFTKDQITDMTKDWIDALF